MRFSGWSIWILDPCYLQEDFRLKYPTYSTSCIGDGGNELGMGSISNLIHDHVANGKTIASASPCDILLCASVSNWGGYATAAALEVLSKVGNTEDENIKTTLLTSEKEEINTIQASNDAGARDGISGKGDLYVDGMDISVHIGILKELETICKI